MGAVSSTSWVTTSKPLLRRCATHSWQQPQLGVFQTVTWLALLEASARKGWLRTAAPTSASGYRNAKQQ
jgi:hypothetical protein